MYYCVSEFVFRVIQDIPIQSLFKIIDSKIRKISKAFELPEHLFCFIQNIRSQEKTVWHRISTSKFFRFQIINVFEIFRKTFRSSF